MATAVCMLYLSVDDEGLAQSAWSVYLEAFGDAAVKCIQDQTCYDEQSFGEALRDSDYLKFILHDGVETLGILMATYNLEKARVTYVNPTRLEAACPEKKGNILYFTAVAIRPDLQGKYLTEPLFTAATEYVDRHDSVVAFDFSVEKNGALPRLLMKSMRHAQRKLGLRSQDVEYSPLGGQEYGVIKLK